MALQVLEDIVLPAPHRGMADDSAVADIKLPREQARYIRNFDTDQIGTLTSRNGITRIGSAAVIADNAILGLTHHVGTNSRLVAFVNNSGDTFAEAYYLSGSTWTNKALAFTKDIKVRTVSYLNYLIAVNGTDSPKSWTGAAGDAWGTTLLTSAPTGSLIAVFRNQVFIGNTSTDTVYFSTIPSGGSITWPAANNFVVSPNDGSNLTAFVPFAKEMLIFKRKYFYRYNIRSIDPDPFFEFGTASQESVGVQSGIVWFFDPLKRSIFAYSGGYPEDIGRPIQKFLRAVPTSSEANVTFRSGYDFIEFHLGDITVDGVALTNVSARYRISSQTWVVRTYAKEFRVSATYDNGTDILSVQGTTDGHVVSMDTGSDDMGTPIGLEMEHGWLSSNQSGIMLRISELIAAVDTNVGLDIQIKTDVDPTWRSVGRTSAYTTTFRFTGTDFHRVKFRVTGTRASGVIRYEGLRLVEPQLVRKD